MTTAYSTPFDGIGVSPWYPRPIEVVLYGCAPPDALPFPCPPVVPAPTPPPLIPLPGTGGLVEAVRSRLAEALAKRATLDAEIETLERMLAAAEGRGR